MPTLQEWLDRVRRDIIEGKVPETLQFFTISEAAALLHVNRDHLYRLVREGKIPFCRFGERTYRIPAGALLEWLTEEIEQARSRQDGHS